MRKTLYLSTALLLVSLGVAGAQTSTDPEPEPPPTPLTQVSAEALLSLSQWVKSGGTVELLNAAEQVVATVNADGTLTLAQGAQLEAVTSVKVSSGEASNTYALVAKATGGGMLFVTHTNAQGKTQTVPLVAAINRAAAAARKPATKDAQQAETSLSTATSVAVEAPKATPAGHKGKKP